MLGHLVVPRKRPIPIPALEPSSMAKLSPIFPSLGARLAETPSLPSLVWVDADLLVQALEQSVLVLSG